MTDQDPSSNSQIDHTDSTVPGQPDQKKMDHIAEDMATKAGRVQSKDESSINDGKVSPGGGGIFSK